MSEPREKVSQISKRIDKSYLCRKNKLQVETHVSAYCIYKVNWLLPFNLPRDPGNNILDVENYLEDLDIRLAVNRVSFHC